MDLVDRHQYIVSLIRAHSPYDFAETERILAKFFARPSRLACLLADQYGFHRMKVLDIGSSYGQTLLHWGQPSEGFDVSERFCDFLRSLGRTMHQGNAEDGMLSLQPESFDAVFTNNLLEHLVAPHLFTARLFSILKPDGILAIGHPVVPPQPFRTVWRALGFGGWLAAEHINFFTCRTVRHFLERSGFRVERQYFSGLASIPWLSTATVPLGVHCLSVCRKKAGFTYPDKRAVEFDPSWAKDLACFRPGQPPIPYIRDEDSFMSLN